MGRIEFTYAGELYDRTAGLRDGTISVEGAQFRYLHLPIEQVFWRQSGSPEFDGAEYSFGAYLASVDDSDRALTAIPVFPSKAFRHASVYVRHDGPNDPSELSSRPIGTPEWSMTASLWMRGILGEHYSVDLASIAWRTGGVDQPGRREKSRVKPPRDFDVQMIADDETLGELLVGGGIDALISARPPRCFRDGRVRRLFADPRSEERRYFDATGIVPVMHVVVIRRDVCERHPWLANNIRDAFERASIGVHERLTDNAVSLSSLLWEATYAAEESAIFGGDPFRHGIETNRRSLATLCRYGHEQGFTNQLLSPEDLFEPSTCSDSRV